ncbi:hypothetical protein ABWJ92_35215 [Streptomyces sp. NPDC000609]|uniref:hypothetical protein n=1 Tax=Streptomyces sp. NPDC000609 TaxID=3160957 RepID=UPI00339B4135
MAWSEWEQLKADAANRNNTQMQLNKAGPAGSGREQGDLKVDQQDLAAVGDSAFKLFEDLAQHGRDAWSSSQAAARDLTSQEFELGGGLDQMDIEELRHGNFASLGTAIKDWTGMITHLTAMEKTARDDLMAKANRANWAGVNATVSREFINRTAEEFTDAVTQATSIRNILRDTRSELISYHDELNRLIDRGWDKHLSVVGTKGGGFTVFVTVHPEPAGSREAMELLRDDLQAILNKATESDRTAAEVLKAIANHADYGFSDTSYKDCDTAADALQAAKDMARIVNKDPSDRTAEDLAKLNTQLKKYHDDPLFSEQFALSAGAKGTLQFWAEVTDRYAGVKGAELEGLKDLQNNLSLTLASATYSDSTQMREWKHSLINAGNTDFRADPANPLKGSIGAMGFQVISSLMGHGKYDSEFLEEYGKRLLKSDMAPAGGVGMNTKDVWTVPEQSADLIFGTVMGTTQ